MLYGEIIAVCSQIHTKHTNTLCGQNVEFVNVKRGGTCSNHWAVKEYSAIFIAQGPLENVARAAYRSFTVKVLFFKENLFFINILAPEFYI